MNYFLTGQNSVAQQFIIVKIPASSSIPLQAFDITSFIFRKMIGTAFAFILIRQLCVFPDKAKTMAKDEKDKEEQEEQEEGKKKGSSTTKIIIITVLAAALLSGGLVGATFYFVSGMNDDKEVAARQTDENEEEDEEEEAEAEEDEEPKGPAQYYSLDPKFVVSFRDQHSARFMQFSLEVMTRDKNVVKKISEHTPAIRSSLLMLFDSQGHDVMSTREGKKQLLLDITEDINETLSNVVDSSEEISVVEAAYFTSFVIQ